MALPGASKRHDKRQTEFGGRDGVIQSAADGHERLTIGEQAHILRTHNMWNNDEDFYVLTGETSLENAQSGWQTGERVDDSHLIEATERLNGRTPDDVTDVENLL